VSPPSSYGLELAWKEKLPKKHPEENYQREQ
jgi:hypothetical protein